MVVGRDRARRRASGVRDYPERPARADRSIVGGWSMHVAVAVHWVGGGSEPRVPGCRACRCAGVFPRMVPLVPTASGWARRVPLRPHSQWRHRVMHGRVAVVVLAVQEVDVRPVVIAVDSPTWPHVGASLPQLYWSGSIVVPLSPLGAGSWTSWAAVVVEAPAPAVCRERPKTTATREATSMTTVRPRRRGGLLGSVKGFTFHWGNCCGPDVGRTTLRSPASKCRVQTPCVRTLCSTRSTRRLRRGAVFWMTEWPIDS